ncbi:hypothetical protein I3843_01G088100 [Carya illinoinensis]|nr:hypothetical protein I3843_01G088100 [Carya illinoinensis]
MLKSLSLVNLQWSMDFVGTRHFFEVDSYRSMHGRVNDGSRALNFYRIVGWMHRIIDQ